MIPSKPAFPTDDGRDVAGMTLREWYAGKAMAGLLMSFGAKLCPIETASDAFSYADAMLAEAAKELK